MERISKNIDQLQGVAKHAVKFYSGAGCKTFEKGLFFTSHFFHLLPRAEQ